MGKGWLWAMLALTLAAGVGACSSGGGSPATPAPSPTSATPPVATSSAAAPASTAPVLLPTYQPSKVISEAGGHTQLSSADPVSKVTRFYEDALKRGGWTIVSSAKTAASTSIVAKRGGGGVTIAISSAGPAGTSISVTIYPA